MTLAHPQLPLTLPIREESTFANFIVGDNADLVAQLIRLARGDATGLGYIWGYPGSGRSHMLQAACHLAGDRGRSAIYLPLGEVKALGPGVLQDIEDIDLICIDDVEVADPDWEEGLFHLYNRLMASGGTLLVAGSASPAGLGLGLADLVSRLSSGVTYRMADLDDEGLLQMLRKRAAHKGLAVSPETLRYLLSRSERSVSNLLRVLDQLDASAMAAGRKLTIPLIKDVMKW